MFTELNKLKDMLVAFGGHKQAAGLSIKETDLEELRKLLNQNCTLTEDQMTKKVIIDIVKDIGTLNTGYLRSLDVLEPFRNRNEKPLFAQKMFLPKKSELLAKTKTC